MDAFRSDDTVQTDQNLENLNRSAESFLNSTVLGAAYNREEGDNYDSSFFSELDEIFEADCDSYEIYKHNFDEIKQELDEEKAEMITALYRHYSNGGDEL